MICRCIPTFILTAGLALMGSGAAAVEPPTTSRVQGQELREHPRFQKAIEELHAAIRQLQAAPHDFGGHRAEAVQACEQAIAQLKQALAFDRKHEGGSHK